MQVSLALRQPTRRRAKRDRYEIHQRKGSAAKALEITELDLSGQFLKRFPAAVKKLRNLQTLRLQGNVLSDLPEWLAELPLAQLDYSGNRLSDLPGVIGTLKTLDWLKVGEDPLVALPDFLADLPVLRTFRRGVRARRPRPTHAA